MNNQYLIGIDFSLNKPAACILHNNKYEFFFFPKDLKQSSIELFRNSGVNVIERPKLETKKTDESNHIRENIIESDMLSDLIIKTIRPYLNKNTIIAFESSSYGSKGSYVIQLATYRYLFIYKLSKIIGLDNIYSYAPQSIKKVAMCSFKGSTKIDVIESFIKNGPDCKLRDNMIENKSLFLKKKSKNFIDGTDDNTDAFFIVQTLIEKLGC